MKEQFLDERVRAEDIILGSLGFGEDATITEIERTEDGFQGQGSFSDGEVFEFESDDELSDLEHWALDVLLDTPDTKVA